MAAAESDPSKAESRSFELLHATGEEVASAEYSEQDLAIVTDLDNLRRARQLKPYHGPNEVLVGGTSEESGKPQELTGEQTQLFHNFFHLAEFIARKIFSTGDYPSSEFDSMMSDSYFGLIKAVKKFDKERLPSEAIGTNFFYQSIQGEVKRGIRARYGRVSHAKDKKTGERPENAGKTARLKPSVTIGTAQSFDQPHSRSDSAGRTLGETLASNDLNGSELGILLLGVRLVIEDFKPRDKEIFIRRFYLDQTQQEIGKAVGVSQMHVSRSLRKALAQVQNQLD